MSTPAKKGTSKRVQKEAPGAAGSKSQLLLVLKDQVVQLQQQLLEERGEREKISSWLASTLKPRLKTQFDLQREELDSHSSQIQKISQYLKEHHGSSGGTVTREEYEELQTSVAIEREARQQLSLWLKLNFGKNLEILDARIDERSGGGNGVGNSGQLSSVTVLPESATEWLRMIGYERYIAEFQRAKCTDISRVVRLTDDHLVKIGIALKRHRGDILHELSALKDKLEAAKNQKSDSTPDLLSTPKRSSTPVSSDGESIDPFSDSAIENRATEQVTEKNRILEAEKRRLKEQFDMEKKRWMEEERQRIRKEVETQELERIKQEEKKISKKLERERMDLEARQQEIERKERETKLDAEKVRKEQKKNIKLAEQEKAQDQDSLSAKRDAKEKEMAEKRKERERKEQEDKERKVQEERERIAEQARLKQEAAKKAAEEKKAESVEDDIDIVEEKPVVIVKEIPKPKESKKIVVKKESAPSSDSDGKSFDALIEEVRNDDSPTNWVAFYFDKSSNSIKLTGCGSNGHEELLSVLEDDKVQYAMLRVVDHKGRIKFIYIHWVGSKAHAFLKARSGTKKADMLKLMGQFHLEVPAETKDDISKQSILTKLKAAVNF